MVNITLIIMKIITLSQQDKRWGNITLGNTNYKMSRYGCLVTCLSAISDWCRQFKGMYINPGEAARGLRFNKDGLLLWESLGGIFQFVLEKRLYHSSPTLIKAAMDDPYRCVVLQVNSNHWVWCLGKSLLGGWKIMDPWYGDVSTTRRYKNNISGFAILKLK
ncbi:MAG: hypothetical protein A4E53_01733 [Pelotomaculum sp. PtaB.Bin104]|nr:MAG: hypothetical protein A4E53_01733 [Pelotomaculum sp. PtaB.Bin104]